MPVGFGRGNCYTLVSRHSTGGAYGRQRIQKMRASGLYVSGHFGEILQPAVRDHGENPGRGLQVSSLGLRGQNGIRGPRVMRKDAQAAHPQAVY